MGTIHAEQQAIGYESELVQGQQDCQRYMRGLFEDWQASGITVALHEKRGGYANNFSSLKGLLGKAEAEGVRIETGVRVTGIQTEGRRGHRGGNRPRHDRVRPPSSSGPARG